MIKDNYFLRCCTIFAKVRLILACLSFLFAFGSAANAQFVDATRVNTGAMTHDEWATQVLSSPTGKEIISAGVDGRVVIWDAATGKVLREVTLPASVLSLSLSNDGSTLAAGDVSGSVSLIDTASAKIKNSFKADTNIVNASAWSEDGKFLVAGGSDGIVRVWSVSEQKITGEISPAHGNVTSLTFANSQLAIGMLNFKENKAVLEIWDYQNKKLVLTINEGAPALRGISVSSDGKLLAVADFQKATLLSILSEGGNSISVSVHALPDSDEMTEVAVWDLATGKRVGLV